MRLHVDSDGRLTGRRRGDLQGHRGVDRQRRLELQHETLAAGSELGQAAGELRGDLGVDALAEAEDQRVEAGTRQLYRSQRRVGGGLGTADQLQQRGGDIGHAATMQGVGLTGVNLCLVSPPVVADPHPCPLPARGRETLTPASQHASPSPLRGGIKGGGRPPPALVRPQ
ncbi:hypothetical protein ASC89_13285 [Devosia sp. Root413D1]|nr:hypothetical protein ASC89_13285 [Devosia sp. Root413D1]